MSFAENLKKLREEKGVTQQELAEYLGVGRPTIAGYETKNKQPDFEKLINIAKFFNVSTDYLLGLTNQRCLFVAEHPAKNEVSNKEVDEIVNESQVAADIGKQFGREASPELIKLIREVVRESLEEKRNEKNK